MNSLKQLESTQDKILFRIEAIEYNLSNKVMSLVNSFEGLSKMLSETFLEVINLKKTVQTSASSFDLIQDYSGKRQQYERMESHESSNTVKNDDNRLMTFNKQSICSDSIIRWQCTQNYGKNSSQARETESNGPLKIIENFDYEKNLKEISSMTSVFNLSQTLDKNNNGTKSNRFETNHIFDEIEAKLEDIRINVSYTLLFIKNRKTKITF